MHWKAHLETLQSRFSMRLHYRQIIPPQRPSNFPASLLNVCYHSRVQPLIELQNIDVAIDGTPILRDLTWQLHSGEHWIISGRNGSGKSTFLKLLRGDVSPVPKKGWRFSRLGGIQQSTAVGLKERIALVSPELQA